MMRDIDTEMLRVKEIERILWPEILNWLRWGRMRDFYPPSYKCILGALRIHDRVPAGDDRYDPHYKPYIKPNEVSAAGFERLVQKLPERHKRAFVMYRLGVGVDNGRVVEIESKQHMARLLCVQERMMQTLVQQAHNIVLREYRNLVAK